MSSRPTIADDALIEAIREALAGIEADRVRVDGDGARADELRAQLAAQSPGGDHPLAIVETTGTPAGLRAACEQVADRGLVLLAGESGEPVDIDLYREAHRRGLELIGIREAP